jgi:hypothetical protein
VLSGRVDVWSLIVVIKASRWHRERRRDVEGFCFRCECSCFEGFAFVNCLLEGLEWLRCRLRHRRSCWSCLARLSDVERLRCVLAFKGL